MTSTVSTGTAGRGAAARGAAATATAGAAWRAAAGASSTKGIPPSAMSCGSEVASAAAKKAGRTAT